MQYIYGRNPVIEALRHGKEIQKLYLLYDARGEKINTIYRLTKQRRIPLTRADAKKFRSMVGDALHQGVVALVSSIRTLTLDEQLSSLNPHQPGCLLILDRIQDPHNMGAIIRSGEVFGAEGVIFSSRENVPITETVLKASAGAALHLPLCKVDKLSRAVRQLKDDGFWVYGTSPDAKVNLWEMDFRRKCAIIIGNEEKGIRPSLLKECDDLFKIPQSGKTESLNASVAAGIILAEVQRQIHFLQE